MEDLLKYLGSDFTIHVLDSKGIQDWYPAVLDHANSISDIVPFDLDVSIRAAEETVNTSDSSYVIRNKQGIVVGVVISGITDFWYSKQQVLSPLLLWVKEDYRENVRIIRTLVRLIRIRAAELFLPLYIETIKGQHVRGILYRRGTE